jgi:hypothetical protein
MSDQKLMRYRYQLLNIKLQTHKTDVEKENAYSSLIKNMKELRLHSAVSKDKHITIYNFYERTIENTDAKYLYGYIGKGLCFDKEMITNIDLSQSENLESKVQVQKDLLINAELTTYIFVPSVHKFCIILNNSINANQVHKFFKNSLGFVTDKDDIWNIDIVKDPKITDDILSAFAIHSLNYSISYTNDDPNKSIDKLFDQRLKRLNIGNIDVNMQSDNTGSFNIKEEDELIQGGILLAEQNGQINEVVITRHEGEKRVKLSNQQKPATFEIEAFELDYMKIIVQNIIKLFTNHDHD